MIPLSVMIYIEFSQGFPHYTHLMAKYAAQAALESAEIEIRREHFDHAIEEAIENANESIREAYHAAVMTTRREAMFKYVIAACALVKEDEHGTFRAIDLQDPLLKITGKHHMLQAYIYHLGKLCHDDRGSVMQKVGTEKQHRYRFRSPLLRAFVRIKLYQSHQLTG